MWFGKKVKSTSAPPYGRLAPEEASHRGCSASQRCRAARRELDL
jgi:hypothetical protein